MPCPTPSASAAPTAAWFSSGGRNDDPDGTPLIVILSDEVVRNGGRPRSRRTCIFRPTALHQQLSPQAVARAQQPRDENQQSTRLGNGAAIRLRNQFHIAAAVLVVHKPLLRAVVEDVVLD